jgi:sporadic carbohydrate cluster protein (TIGR04323 family)
MTLTSTQQHWNNATLNYNLEKYNWPKWALGVVQEIAPEVDQLETMHQVLSPAMIVQVGKHVQNACSRKDFMEKFDEFVAEYIPQRIDNKRYLIQRQGTLRVVIPDQAKSGRRLQFHQGIFVGNGRGCRTIWTPLTEARDTNTMWIMDLDASHDVTRRFLSEEWTLNKFEDECLKHAWPVTLKPGQSHLFMQEHLHGNVNNNEGYTRVSMDLRILVEGEEYGRRTPGGFMRLPGDHEVSETHDYTGSKFITYAGWNSAFSKNIPLPMQRATIETYCVKNKISYNDYQFENEHTDWEPSLEYFIRERPDGIVLCSMYSLPDDVNRRRELLQLAVDLGVEMHFANELCSVKTASDLERIETYVNFAVAKSGPYNWEINEQR